jgi:hypothetical protein
VRYGRLTEAQIRANRAAEIAQGALVELEGSLPDTPLHRTIKSQLRAFVQSHAVGASGMGLSWMAYGLKRLGDYCTDDAADERLYGYGCEFAAIGAAL